MSPKQTALYWREWSAAKKAGALTDADRYEIMAEALQIRDREGAISSKDLTNEQLDKVLAAFRKISQPHNLNAQLHALNGPRERLLHGISQTADLAYIEAVAHDKFRTTDIETLDPTQLRQLLMTLKQRAKKKSPIAHRPSPISEPVAADNIPF